MTPEQVFMYSKSYRLYFSSEGYDFMKYKGHVSTPKLITQRDRQFYYRLATKLSDAQIHAAFLQAYFFKPTAYISDVATPTAIQAGIEFASRAEHGTSVLGRDLYTLRKAIAPADLDQWLYGAFFDGFRATLPVCIEELVGRTLPVDVACLLLLIPRTESQYHWAQYWETREPLGSTFGVRPWLSRLRKADQLLNWQRPTWRQYTHKLSSMFWASYQEQSLTPNKEETRLFA
jgi:hypothetical protein